ncbi:MAG TPA: pirin family protein [Fluviicoccus sp.]|nr:pirin family protein [Fluviicoccus sp.]
MITVHPAANRGHANFGWLDSFHSFSFGSWYDPRYMGVSALRVINDDRIRALTGFGQHPHDNMEILTYVLKGVISHKDSMGNETHLRAGQFQLMSAGSGITHSEHNRQPHEETRILQIWLYPDRQNTAPGYQELQPDDRAGLRLIVSPDGTDGSMRILQNARIYRLKLDADQRLTLPLDGSTGYLHVISGQVHLDRTLLTDGDGAEATTDSRELHTLTAAEALWFDLP